MVQHLVEGFLVGRQCVRLLAGQHIPDGLLETLTLELVLGRSGLPIIARDMNHERGFSGTE